MKRVSVVLPVLAPTPFLWGLAEFALHNLAVQAARPDELELIVCEATPQPCLKNICDAIGAKYFHFVPQLGGVAEINYGIAQATGEFVLLTGTDIIPPAGYDDELINVFDEGPRCMAATLSAFEPNATIGPPAPLDMIVEGMFSPFTMLRREDGWMYDESYQRIYQDSDLIMRIYAAGGRAYRSCRKHVWHLGSVTNTQAGVAHAEMHATALAHDERLFYQRWGKSPLAMFGMIRGGAQVYGREHDAFVCPITLHHDPNG